MDLTRLAEWDDEDKRWLADMYGMSGLLNRCILVSNYRLTDEWSAAIKLTETGATLTAKLRAKRVKPNESVLVAFLHLFVDDQMLVDRATSIDTLRSLLSKNILSNKIRYPYILGRAAADVCNKLFPQVSSLDVAQTSKLLDALPAGIFQEGSTVVGPLGAFRSKQFRALVAGMHEFPGYLCDELHCDQLHSIDLRTGSSPIHRAQTVITDLIEKDYIHRPEIVREMGRIVQEQMSLTSEQRSNSLFDAIYDNLLDGELRGLLVELVRFECQQPGGRAMMQKRWSTIIANPAEIVSGRSRPEIEQMILYFTDDEIVDAVDRCVRLKIIAVDEYTSREPFISRFPSGAWGLTATIGLYGIRFAKPNASGLVSSLSRLIHEIYINPDSVLTSDHLAFALDRVDGEDVSAALRKFLASENPEKILDQLVLNSKEASDMAAGKFGLHDELKEGKKKYRAALLWKLGSPLLAQQTISQAVREECLQVRQALSNEGTPENTMRGLLTNMYVAFEELLQRALVYSTWALTTDHYAQIHRFSFDLSSDSLLLQWIEDRAPTRDGLLALTPGGKNNLSTLGAGFGRLSTALGGLDASSLDVIRSAKDYPLECVYGETKFAFPFKVFFLNLDFASRDLVRRDLTEVARLSQSQVLSEVRNATSHGNNEFPMPSMIERASTDVLAVVERLEDSGLSPIVFEMQQRTVDPYGREKIVFKYYSKSLSLNFPTIELAPGLPLRAHRQLIMQNYMLGEAGPLRFSIDGPAPRGGYWENWPPRWPEREISIADAIAVPGYSTEHSENEAG